MNPSTETGGITRRSLAETYEAQDLIIAAAQDAKREATKAYREQLDRVGMDKDAIKSEVEGFKKAFRRKMDGQKKGTEAVEHVDAIADEIFLEITSPAPRATRVAIDVPSFVAFTSDGSEYAYDAETGEITEPQEAQAPAQAGPDDAPVASVPVESIAAEISTPIQSETANEIESGERAVTGTGPESTGAIPGRELPKDASDPALTAPNAGSSNGRTAEFDSADAGSTPAPASIIYPAPGVVVMETCPPEGALAHPYAACWPVRDIDVSEGVREPIVKIGKLILDGRGRMFAARGWDGGKGREYPVVQYYGTDPLMDCIRWNLASRPGIHSHNLKLIAGKLAKLEPTRADEIMQAFGLEVAEAAQ